MKKAYLMKMLAGVMAAVLAVSMPVGAAEEIGTVQTGADTAAETPQGEDGEKAACETAGEEISDGETPVEIPDEAAAGEVPDGEDATDIPDGSDSSEVPEDDGAAELSEESGSTETPEEDETAETPEGLAEEGASDDEASGDLTVDIVSSDEDTGAEDIDPEDSEELPDDSDGEEDLPDPEENPGGTVGLVEWNIRDGILTVTGTGDFLDPESTEYVPAPWNNFADRITDARITLTECTKLDGMFRDCINLNTVDLSGLAAEKLLSAEGMFEGCGKLVQIIIPKRVKIEIALPLADENAVWYLEDGSEVKEVPDREDSVTLYSREEMVPLPKELNCYYARKVGEDPEKTIQMKGDIWIAGFEKASLVYTGYAVTQDIRVYDRKRLMQKGTEYSLSYKNNVAAKSLDESKAPSVTVKLVGQYTGSRTYTYSILRADISGASIIDDGAAVSYSGKKQEFSPKIVFNGKTLKKNTDYTLSYLGDTTGDANGITPVPYTVSGKGSFLEGTVCNGTYYIVGADYNFSKAVLTFDKSVRYDGTPIPVGQLVTAVKIKGKPIDAQNYEITPAYIDDAGPTAITVRPSAEGQNAKYRGFCTKTYKVLGAVDLKSKVTVDDGIWQKELFYNRTKCTQGDGIEQNTAGLLKVDGKTLIRDEDFTVKYAGNKKVGTAKVTFTGCGRYNGSFTKSFRIKPSEEKLKVTLPYSVPYAKGGAIPAIVVKDQDGNVLKVNTDYTLQLTGNKVCGSSASYKVTGKGCYSKNTVETGSFTVAQAQLSSVCDMTAADKTYNKKKRNYFKSTPVLYDSQNGKKLKAGTDYEKLFIYQEKQSETSYREMGDGETPEPGTIIKVIAKGMGNYTGECSRTYKIYEKKYDISKLYIKIDQQTYTGEEIRPALSEGDGRGGIHLYETKSDMKAGNELKASAYVEVVSYAKNIKAGTASVTLRAKTSGEYGGQKTYKFTIKKKSVALVGVTTVIVEESCLSIDSGKTAQLSVRVLPLDADEWTATWSSANQAVASVDETGLVTGIKKGITSVTATVKDAKGKTVKGSSKIFVDRKVIVVDAVTGDGKDDSAAFNAAIAEASSQNKGVAEDNRTIVWVPAGTYHINVNDPYKKIEVKSDVTIMMDSKTVIQALPTSNSSYYIFWIAGADNVHIDGGKGKVVGSYSGSDGGDGHCVGVVESRNVTIENLNISNGWGDGVYIGINSANYGNTSRYVKNVTIKNCTIYNNRRNNIGITNGSNINIIGCTLRNHGTNEGLCIETNNDSVPVTNVRVENSLISGSVKQAMGIPRPARDVYFKKCTIDGIAYNGGCGGLVFDACTITGDLTEANHSRSPWYGHASLINGTTVGGEHTAYD